MAKRLIERMSSIIIDKECIESLIDLVEYKVKQKLTFKQRKLLNKRKKKAEPASNKNSRNKKSKKVIPKSKEFDSDASDENNEDNEDDYDDEDDLNFNEEETFDNVDTIEDEDMDEDDTETKTTESSKNDDIENDRLLVRHIDDDGEKGIKLLSFIFLIHNNYGFANSTTYQKLFTFVNSRKDHVVSSSLHLLSTYFTLNTRLNIPKEENDLFNTINNNHLDKLKHFCKYGKAKQAKHSINLIFKNFEKPKNEEILYDLYKVNFFNQKI